MTSEPRWSRAALPWRVTIDGVLVATADAERLLSGSAAVVWDALEQTRTEEELLRECAQGYDLDAGAAAAGLAALAEAGLCERI